MLSNYIPESDETFSDKDEGENFAAVLDVLLPSSTRPPARLPQLFCLLSNPAWQLAGAWQTRQAALSGPAPSRFVLSPRCRWTAHTPCVSPIHRGVARLSTLTPALVLEMLLGRFVSWLLPRPLSGRHSNSTSWDDLHGGPGSGRRLCLS